LFYTVKIKKGYTVSPTLLYFLNAFADLFFCHATIRFKKQPDEKQKIILLFIAQENKSSFFRLNKKERCNH
jgi:hypothetical protein